MLVVPFFRGCLFRALLTKTCHKKQENERVLVMTKYLEPPRHLSRLRGYIGMVCLKNVCCFCGMVGVLSSD